MRILLLALLVSLNCYAGNFYSMSTSKICEVSFDNKLLDCHGPDKWDQDYGISVDETTWCRKEERTGECEDQPILYKDENIITLSKKGLAGSSLIHLMLKTNVFVETEVSYSKALEKYSTYVTKGTFR